MNRARVAVVGAGVSGLTAPLRLWRERFNQNWADASELGFNDTFRRMWEFYLAYCQAGLRTGYLNVAQLTLER